MKLIIKQLKSIFLKSVIITIAITLSSCNESTKSDYLFEISVEDKDGYIDSTGSIVIKPKYYALKSLGEGLVAFKENDKWGYIDYDENVKIKPQYEWCSAFSEGYASVQDQNHKYGIIDKKGKWIIEPIYDWVSSPNNGIILVQIKYSSEEGKLVHDFRNEMVGAIDLNAREVIPIKYTMNSEAPGFTDDLIVLGDMNGGFQVFSKEGKKLYSKDFYIGNFSNKLAHCYDIKTNEHFFIDKNGNKKFTMESSITYVGDFKEGLAPFKDSFKKWGFIDTTGAIKIIPEYNYVGHFNNGIALVKTGEKYGFINKSGQVIIPTVYDDANDFNHSLAYVKLGLREGYINCENRWIWEKGK